MRALSVMQPWATLIAIGAKRIETRSWATKYRGPLAIHASAKTSRRQRLLALSRPIADALIEAGVILPEDEPDIPVGAIICVCDLVDVIKISADNIPPEPERSFGDYTPGRYAWHLANVRVLPRPIPAKGRLGLWMPPPDVLAALEVAVG